MLQDSLLEESYRKVGKKIFKINHLSKKSIKSSIDLFTKKSLKVRKPMPINVEVYTLVSGLPFSKNLINIMSKIQNYLNLNLKKTLCYWVKPENLGVEYCVFKWPNDNWDNKWIGEIKKFLKKKNYDTFDLKVSGIQLHDDGCIIAKGFDSNSIRNIRSDILENLKFLPKKQSNWAHIPIGRILEPISKEKFFNVKKMISSLSNEEFATEKIRNVKLIYETRWYMERRKILYTKKLKD